MPVPAVRADARPLRAVCWWLGRSQPATWRWCSSMTNFDPWLISDVAAWHTLTHDSYMSQGVAVSRAAWVKAWQCIVQHESRRVCLVQHESRRGSVSCSMHESKAWQCLVQHESRCGSVSCSMSQGVAVSRAAWDKAWQCFVQHETRRGSVSCSMSQGVAASRAVWVKAWQCLVQCPQAWSVHTRWLVQPYWYTGIRWCPVLILLAIYRLFSLWEICLDGVEGRQKY